MPIDNSTDDKPNGLGDVTGPLTLPRVAPAGDAAWMVTLGTRQDKAVSRRVLTLGRRVMAAGLDGVIEVVPAMASLTVHVDPDRCDAAVVAAHLMALAAADIDDGGAAGRCWRLPVCYDPAVAPDLAEVAARTGLSIDEVVARHGAVTYHVYMLGFLPGFPYLGDLDPALRLPRRETPRVAVPAGAVAIAGLMTAVYPLESPGGWHIIGRTPARLFDPLADPPALLAPGDGVRCVPLSRAAFDKLEADAAAGRWVLDASNATDEVRP